MLIRQLEAEILKILVSKVAILFFVNSGKCHVIPDVHPHFYVTLGGPRAESSGKIRGG